MGKFAGRVFFAGWSHPTCRLVTSLYSSIFSLMKGCGLSASKLKFQALIQTFLVPWAAGSLRVPIEHRVLLEHWCSESERIRLLGAGT